MGLLLALSMTVSVFVGFFFVLVFGLELVTSLTLSDGEQFLLNKEKEEGVIKLPSGRY